MAGTAKTRCSDERGLALVSVAIIATILLILTFSLVQTVLLNRRTTKDLESDFFAVQIAEAGIDKAIFCLNATSGSNCGGTFGINYTGETDIPFGSGSFSTSVAAGGGEGTIISMGISPSGKTATINVKVTTLPPSDDITFGYALQSGGEGAHFENNSGISGTIYSNGDISCQSTQAVIDGDAFVAKTDGYIDGCTVNYHAYADRILNSDVLGNAYYDVDPDGIAGTTVSGTKYPNQAAPVPEALPEIDLDFWHAAALEGGIIVGDYSPASGSSLGPKKIEGNLLFGNNVDLTLTGPLWVTGDVITGNNGSITLDSAFGTDSTVILADDPDGIKGKVLMTPNFSIAGSGQPTSHVLLISTNTSTDPDNAAMDVFNNASGAIFYALHGILRLHNLAGAKSLAGSGLWLDQNATVTYIESELSGMNFSNSPGGRWRLLEGTWARL